jgi:hypothetical protein
MIRALHALSFIITVTVAPAYADDGFMAIHMANQKIGSPLAEFWAGITMAQSWDGSAALPSRAASVPARVRARPSSSGSPTVSSVGSSCLL